MKKNRYIFVAILTLIGFTAQTQTVSTSANILTLQKAIEIALVNNYDLKIAENTLKQADNNNSAGNAGLLPSASINGGAEYAISDNEKKYGRSVPNTTEVVNGSETVGYNASARLDYTLFDGFGNVYTYQKLKQANQLQETLYKVQMENTILMVAQYYYEVCRASQNLTLAGESMNISRDRLNRTLDQQAYGQATQLNILNAEVDLNSDSTFILKAEQTYLMAVKNLNVVMGIPIDETYSIDDTITFRDDLSAENIMADVLENNSRLLAQKQQESVTQLNMKITEAAKYPKLSAYGQYGYNHQDFNTGALLSNQTMGTSAGLTFKFNVFNGNQQRTREQNARLDLLSQKERSMQLQSEMERDAANAFTDYDYKRRISQLQQSSLDRAKLNFEKTSELYQLGRATSLEFRTAQQNMLNVANLYNEALFSAKVAEFNLLKLSGKLIN